MTESIQEKRARRRRRKREARQGEIEAENTELEKGITEKKGYATRSRRKGEGEVDEGNALTRPFRGPLNYFEGVRSELEKVTWPTPEETQRLSYIVAVVTVASSLFLGGLALIFTRLFNIGVETPTVFIGAFVAFLILLYVYSRYGRSTGSEF